MWTAKWILDAYEEGDRSARWDMYLIYPGLRKYFDEIEARFDKAGDRKAGEPIGARQKAKGSLCARLVKGFGG